MRPVLLVPAPCLESGGRLHGHLPVGLLALRAHGRRRGEVEVLLPREELLGARFASSDEVVDGLLEGLDLDRYGAIGLSTMCGSIHHSMRLARRLRQLRPGLPLWMGGPHASAAPEELLQAETSIDAVFVGEAEAAFAAALARLEAGDGRLEGLVGVMTRGGAFERAPSPRRLDHLPETHLTETDLEFLAAASAAAARPLSVPIEISRGCPGRCTFCSTRNHFGRGARRRSPSRVVAEMLAVSRRSGQARFELVGDHAGAPLRALLAFAERVAADAPGLEWQCDLKLDRLEPGHLDALHRGGCRGFFVGVESGCQETLDRVRKGVSLEGVVAVIRRALAMGFVVKPSFIVGFPWETEEMARQTYRLHAELLRAGATDSQIWLLCPLPGTELAARYPSRLDPRRSRLAADGLPLEPEDLESAARFPALFSHLGRFDTPEVAPERLDAIVDAAAQLRALHVRSARAPSPDR